MIHRMSNGLSCQVHAASIISGVFDVNTTVKAVSILVHFVGALTKKDFGEAAFY